MRRRLAQLAQEDTPFQIERRLAANQHTVALQFAAQIPPRYETWRAFIDVLPSFSLQYGISMLCVDPVTGSSGTLRPGRRSG